jgi:hypothetical protein
MVYGVGLHVAGIAHAQTLSYIEVLAQHLISSTADFQGQRGGRAAAGSG